MSRICQSSSMQAPLNILAMMVMMNDIPSIKMMNLLKRIFSRKNIPAIIISVRCIKNIKSDELQTKTKEAHFRRD